jgi:hypothetical protein
MDNKQFYDEHVKPIMDEMEKQMPFITKKKDGSYVVQSRKDSYMQGFFVNLTLFGYIVMTGDYDGLLVRPYGNEDRLLNWLAGATSLDYFAEKVCCANQHHECKEYSQKVADENIAEIFQNKLDSVKDYIPRPMINPPKTKDVNETIEFLKNTHSVENEHEYYEYIMDIERELDMSDLCEYSPRVYTNQIKWQHKCLVYFANKVLKGEFEEEK